MIWRVSRDAPIWPGRTWTPDSLVINGVPIQPQPMHAVRRATFEEFRAENPNMAAAMNPDDYAYFEISTD